MSKEKVSGIELNLKGKKVTLDIEEARELYKGLAELFEDQSRPVFIPTQPVYIERDRYPYWPRITYGDRTGDTTADNFKITCQTNSLPTTF